jgi:hypothetical protein
MNPICFSLVVGVNSEDFADLGVLAAGEVIPFQWCKQRSIEEPEGSKML